MTTLERHIPNENAMQVLGETLARCCEPPLTLFFIGNIGAGKTTLIRGFLRGLGYQGKVKSPTYTLVEPYKIQANDIYHFDLYRVKDPEELDFIGITEYFHPRAMCLVEWPELGAEKLPPPDLTCYIENDQTGRKIHVIAHTPNGTAVIQQVCDKGL